MNYNFTTRQLYPYSDNWELDLHGALWYVWEDDAICLIDGEAKVYLAKGYVAALLANSQQLYTPDFRPIDFYKAITSNYKNPISQTDVLSKNHIAYCMTGYLL